MHRWSSTTALLIYLDADGSFPPHLRSRYIWWDKSSYFIISSEQNIFQRTALETLILETMHIEKKF
jgi:hypothetical protein